MKKFLIVIPISLLIISLILIILIPKFINKESNSTNDKGENIMNINIIIGDKTFSATLENNETSKKFMDMTPLEIDMSELNGNEKYYYLDKNLPTDSYNPKRINNGDIMLYGSDCLVLFYKSFNTTYSYTRLGSIDDPNGLEESLGNGEITVRIEKNDK